MTVARCCADAGLTVLVVDRRDHIAGNCYDELDEHGCLIHRYGPHIFHTASDKVYEFLGRFTEWVPYEHQVAVDLEADASGAPLGHVPMPVNAETLELFFGVELQTEEDARALLDAVRTPIEHPKNSEEVCLDRVGRQLYEAIFEPYTVKQWGRHPRELAPSVCGRLPVRTDRERRYFRDRYQVMPRDGYRGMFEAMADSPRIDMRLGVDGAEVSGLADRCVWSGCMDEAFDYALGRLPWRSVEFQLHHYEQAELRQPVAVVNSPSPQVAHTRETEYRHLTGQTGLAWTCTHRELPNDRGEPIYPVPSEESARLARRYRELAKGSDLILAGRLGRYQYYEMGQACANALALFEDEWGKLPRDPAYEA